uniref:Putative salivary kunitz domain protein n=1 Tax=Ixodes ricinus TaxID=34613 RepID=A0A0K8R5U9_IXORI
MKSIVAVLCFLAVVVYCTAMLLEEQCRAPHPFASCDGSVPLRNILRSFNQPDTGKELQERSWKKEKIETKNLRPTSTFDASKHLK